MSTESKFVKGGSMVQSRGKQLHIKNRNRQKQLLGFICWLWFDFMWL